MLKNLVSNNNFDWLKGTSRCPDLDSGFAYLFSIFMAIAFSSRMIDSAIHTF
jgi:hypothetical protein